MKIVNSIQNEPEAVKPPPAVPAPRVIPIPITIVEPMETPVDPAPLFDEIERMKNSTLQDLRQIEDRLKLADAEGMEPNRRNAADIARLALELDTLKKVLVELTKRTEKPAAAAAPNTKTEVTELPIRQPAVLSAQSSPASEPEKVSKAPEPAPKSSVPGPQSPLVPDPEKKVALFGKLWNYLNQTGVE